MTHQEECIRCQGSGRIDCDKCSGAGKAQESVEPFKAMFRGLYRKDCPNCHGSGKLRCPACKGTGIRIVGDLL